MILPGLIQLLLTAPGVTALVGTNIYPVQLPTACPMPAITLQIISGKSGVSLTGTALQSTLIQIDCWGTSYANADAVRTALIKFLHLRAATLNDGTVLQAAQFVQPLDTFEWKAEQFRAAAEFRLLYNFAS